MVSSLSDEASVAIANEIEDVFYLRTHGDLLFYTGKQLVQFACSLQDDLVSHVYVVDEVAVEPSATKPDVVQSAESSRLASHKTEGQDVLRETRSAAHHRITAHATELVHQHIGTQNGKVVDGYLASQLCAIANDDAIANDGVVSDMHAFHQQVIIAYNSTPLGSRATVDGYILTNLVVVAYFCRAFLSTELEVLWNGTDDGTREEDIAVADTSAIKHGYAVHKSVIVAYDNSLINIAEGTYLAILTYNGLGMYVCQRANHDAYGLLFITCAVKVASATQFSPMKA